MKIVDIKCEDICFGGNLRNATIDFSNMKTTIVAVITDVVRSGKPVIGFGFNSPGRHGQSGVLTSRIFAKIQAADAFDLLNDDGSNFSPEKIFRIMTQNEKAGGHGDRAHAIGVLDMAIWDLVSKIEGKPLWLMLHERYGTSPYSEQVFCYAAGGYYPKGVTSEKKRLEILADEMKSYKADGFTTLKLKIGGASLNEDMNRLAQVIKIAGDGSITAVDANAKFDLDTAIRYASEMKAYGIMWFEEPGDPNDYFLHASLINQNAVPIAVGENLFSEQDVKNMIIYGNLRSNIDYLQMDANLAYGVTGFVRILKMVKDFGWDESRIYPHGGNLLGLHLCAAFNLGGTECYPGFFKPFGGFYDNTVIKNGYVQLPMECGVGVEQKKVLYDLMVKNLL